MTAGRRHHPRVALALDELRLRLGDGHLRAGDRFFSNRALAQRFGVSYQTAQHLLDILEAEGRLVRRPGSGTFVAGEPARPRRVVLALSDRARVPDSFGDRLRGHLEAAFGAAGLPLEVAYGGQGARPEADTFPLYWEVDPPAPWPRGTYGLLLNRRAPATSALSFLDSVATDDQRGGMLAGLHLRDDLGCQRVAILGGPRGDERSQSRVEGCRTVHGGAKVVWAETWDLSSQAEALALVIRRLRAVRADGLFFANDRLAAQVWEVWPEAEKPAWVGFDDAPVARAWGFSTVAIPWEELAQAAVEVARRRLAGHSGPARTQIVTPRLLVRRGSPGRPA